MLHATGYGHDALASMRAQITAALDNDLASISGFRCLKLYLERLNCAPDSAADAAMQARLLTGSVI